MSKIKRPWQPATYDELDVASMKAFFRGDADKAQQDRAREWILMTLCGIGDQPFIPDSPRETDFALGMRHVALQMVKLTKVRPGPATTEQPNKRHPLQRPRA